jgi:hypothetical protein
MPITNEARQLINNVIKMAPLPVLVPEIPCILVLQDNLIFVQLSKPIL